MRHHKPEVIEAAGTLHALIGPSEGFSIRTVTRFVSQADERSVNFCDQGYLVCLYLVFEGNRKNTFIDMRVYNSIYESYRNLQPAQVYQLHENQKNAAYGDRVINIDSIKDYSRFFDKGRLEHVNAKIAKTINCSQS